MRRSLALLLLTATALTGCTGGKNHTAAPSGTTSATATTAAPATTVSAAPASAPGPTGAVPTSSTSTSTAAPSSAPATPAPSIAPTTPPPLVGALTPAQAKRVANLLSAPASSKVKAPPATCLPVKAEAARKAGFVAAKKTDPLGASTDNPQLLAMVIPAGPDKPQYFLAVKHFTDKADHYAATSLQSFVRAAGSKAWRLCSYPFLFDGVKAPTFGPAVVVPSVTDPATRSHAGAAMASLAKLMTARAKNEKAPVPAGLKVPFAESCTGSPCNRKGFWIQHLKSDAHDSVSRVFTVAQPLHLFRMADGRTLALGVLTAKSQFQIISRNYFFTQNSSRSNWGEQVAPGNFQALTVTDLVQVALEITPAGVATVVGDNYGEFDLHVTR